MTSPAPKLDLETLAASYGYAAAFFNSDPELQDLISQAVAGQWSADKFRAELMASDWYRDHSAAQRVWIELEARDPQEAETRITNQMTKLKQQANQLGVTITDARLRTIARDSLMLGFPDEKIKELIAAEWSWGGPGSTTGTMATLENHMRQLASDYGVTVSDSQLTQYLSGVISGAMTEDHFADYARDMARSKYPGIGQWLDMGMTVRQVAQPYLQSYSQILERNADTIDLNDSLVQRALQGQQGTGGQQPTQAMTLYDFERQLRADPRWQYTANAHRSMQQATSQILRDFGIVG